MKKVLIFNLLLLLNSYGINLLAQQGMWIINNEIGEYPNVKTKYYLFDESNNTIRNLSVSDFAIRDNGENISSIISTNCGNATIDSNLSINISFDLGMSTLGGSNSNFSLAKEFAKSLIAKNFYSEMAISSFDVKTYLNQEFTDTLNYLISAIDDLNADLGSDRKNSFYKEPAGSFKILERGKFNKVLLFITDKNTSIDEAEILKYANEKGIRIYTLMFNKKASNSITNICSKSGGLIIDQIDSTSDINTLANVFKSHILGYLPCEINWQSLYNCNDLHQIDFTIPSLNNITSSFDLFFDNNLKSSLKASPKYISFSSIPIGTKSRQSFTVVANNRDVLIDSLVLQKEFTLKQLKKREDDSTKFDTIDVVVQDMFKIIEGDVKNFLLQKDNFFNVTIEYTAYQEPIIYTELTIASNACISDTVLMTAGYPNRKPITETIKIVHPNLKETLIVGDTSSIKWKGLLPKDIIQVEYSTDNGKTYKTVKNNTEGLEIDWIVPDTPSDSCRVKIYQLWPNNIGQTFYLRHNGQVNSAFFNKSGDYIVTASGDGNAYVWDVFNATLKYKLEGHTDKVNWAMFDPNDKYIVTASDDFTVRIWNFEDGSPVVTLKEHEHKVESVSWCSLGKYFASTDFSGQLIIWDTTWNVYTKIKSNNGPTKYACFNPANNEEIATANIGNISTKDGIKVWNWVNYKNGDKPVKVFDTKANNNWHVTYNQDGSKIAAATESSKPQRLYVWDTDKPEEPLFFISHNFDSTSNNSIISSSFFLHPELNKELILTSSTDNTARLWSAEDGSVFPVIDYIGQNVFGNDKEKHNNAVRTAMFDRIGARVVTASWDSTAIIWNLNQREIQTDVSDSAFRIVRVDGIAKDIDFGELALGFIKDSLITSVFKNETEFTYKIYDIKLFGAHASDFTINIEIKLPLTLLPGDSINFEITFEPKDYGVREAQIEFTIPAKKLISRLSGSAFQQVLFPNNPVVDFGEVRLGNFKDTTFSAIVRNVTVNTVNIDTIIIVGSYKNDFAITSGDKQKFINGNTDLLLTIRFNPLMIGRKNAQIQINYKDKGTPTIINLFGEGIDYTLDSISIVIPDVSGNLGETVSVPIYLKDLSNHSIPKTIEGFYTYLTFNSSILEPIGIFEEDMINGYERKLKLALPYNGNGDSLLTKIDFKVAFGNDSITSLRLENTYPIGIGMLKINEESGSLKVNDLCFDNGVRLFDPNGKITLEQNTPNPASSKTLIRFEVIERGTTKLYIIDLLGNKVLDLIDRELQKGTYEVEVNTINLPNGIYSYILQTPTKYLIKSMQIIKD